MATGSLIDGTLRAQIFTLSRDPMRELAAQMLGVPLHQDDMETFANKAPDRWMQAITQILKAAGYTLDKQEVQVTGPVGLAMRLMTMSDAEAEAMLREHQGGDAQLALGTTDRTSAISQSVQVSREASDPGQPSPSTAAGPRTGVTRSPSTPTPKAPALASGTSTPPPPVVSGPPHAG